MVTVGLLLVGLFLAIVLSIVHIRKRYTFWAAQGIPFVPSLFPLGNIQHASDLMLDLYRELKGKHPFGGIFQFIDPVAMVTDPEMVKNVTVKDFRHFQDRGGYNNPEHDVLSTYMLYAEVDRWMMLRHATSPVFSPGRIKAFFPVMEKIVDRFRIHLNAKLDADGEKVELKDMLGRLNMDISARFLIGIESNNLTASDGGLYAEIIRELFVMPGTWQRFLMICHRPLARKLGLKLYSRHLFELIKQIVQSTIEYRKQRRNVPCENDLLDHLLKLSGAHGRSELTLNEIVAEVFLFMAGYETTTTVISYCLWELAQNPDVQERARKCALEAISNHGAFTYEALGEMSYLDQCMNETLRKHPLSINMTRVVTKDYTMPDSTGVVLRKGLNMIIPVYAIHHDPEYYPDPEQFDPDRFSEEATQQRQLCTFLPFGYGPKICIGYQQAKIHLRTLLAKLLISYSFTTCDEMRGSHSGTHTVIRLEGGLWLHVKRIDL